MSTRPNRLLWGVALVALVVGLAQTLAPAQGITIPNTFTNNTIADADQVNANFAALSAGALNRNGGTMNGDLLFTDATYDIGKTGATRPRDLFISRNGVVGGSLTVGAAMTIAGATFTGDLLFTDGLYDIGKTGATRPRDLFTSRDATIGGSLTVSGATLTATGGQIVFPGTQVPSAGANTLDDYRENTWTPTDASGAALTFTSVVGQYVKVGQLVVATATLTYPATGNGASAAIVMPFTASNSGTAIYGCSINYATESTLRALNIQSNSTTALAYDFSGTLITNATMSTDVVRITCIYRATA